MGFGMRTTRRKILAGLGLVAVGAAGGAAVFAGALSHDPARTAGAQASGPVIRVVKSPYCGCCAKWVDYLAARGWRTEVESQSNLAPVRRRAGVPGGMAGCHTAFVEGYVVEGHVPAGAIEKLLAERPDLDGIAVPGMPADSPGMGGGGIQDVYGFKAGRPTGLYTRARG